MQPTRTNACPFTLHTGFIGGHICAPAGGGEDSLVTLSPALSASFRCWMSESFYRLRAVSLSFWLPADRARGAGLIQTAALVGYPPARALLARNYPQSEAVRSVVPAKDVIRYALGPVMDAVATGEDSKQIFLALGQHFALQGQVDLFATQILSSLRGDSRPQLGYRIDTLLDLLARVPGACGAVARLIPGEREAADRECTFSQNLRKHIETTAPAREEEESKRRGLLMLGHPSGR
jgi:hypothetical protein